MQFLKAVKIFDGEKLLPDETVLVLEGKRIKTIIGEADCDPLQVERLDGILCPGFVNTHCHLELSHLKNAVTRGKGFASFAMELMDRRGQADIKDIESAMQQACIEMKSNGIVAVGDVCNGSTSFQAKASSGLYFHSFVELIALDPRFASTVYEGGVKMLQMLQQHELTGSLAAHAPYSVSPDLINLITSRNREAGQPFSIHNQESEAENNFLLGNPSSLTRLYAHLGLDLSWYSAPRCTALRSFSSYLDNITSILVHNTVTCAEEVAEMQDKEIFWCFCPSANLYIENRLPDFKLFREDAQRICIGTDSLASNDRLDVLYELNYLAASGVFSEEELLAMITLNGARALKIESKFGRIAEGTSPGLNLLKRTGTIFEFSKKIN